MEIKTCCKCGESKPATLEYFSKQARNKTCGLHSRCKVCGNANQKSFRDNNIEKVSEYRKGYYQLNRSRVLSKNKVWADKNKECRSIYNKEWRGGRKDERASYQKEYYENNKEVAKKKAAEYRETNKEKVAEGQKKYYQNNRQSIIETNSQYHKNNKERYAIIRARRRSKKRQRPSTLTNYQWEQIKADFGQACCYCGRVIKLTIEHFIPISNLGETTINNTLGCCQSCNSSKGNRDFFYWYPRQSFFSKQRETKILTYLGYKNGIQQLAFL